MTVLTTSLDRGSEAFAANAAAMRALVADLREKMSSSPALVPRLSGSERSVVSSGSDTTPEPLGRARPGHPRLLGGRHTLFRSRGCPRNQSVGWKAHGSSPATGTAG